MTAHYAVLRMVGFVVAIAQVWVGIAVLPFLVIGGLSGPHLLPLGTIRRDQLAPDPTLTEA